MRLALLAVVAAALAAEPAVSRSGSPLRLILSLTLFGIAFGYLEASVVVYLRTLGGPMRTAASLPAQELFPLLRLDQLTSETLTLVKIELGREAATLLMIAAVALALARNARTWLAAFVLAFGVWDLTFYFWLRVLIGWPASILTWDILFLLPVPWAAPVLAPCIVAATMTIFGAVALTRGADRQASKILPILLTAGSVLILGAFTWDYRLWLSGGMPGHFPWPVFGLGECFIVAGLLSSVTSTAKQVPLS